MPTTIFGSGYPRALLIDREKLVAFLQRENYSIVWAVLGEKQVLATRHLEGGLKKRLDISGVFTINKRGNLIGKTTLRTKG